MLAWIRKRGNRDKLKKNVSGVGDKTADYYGVLVCDPDAVAIDERISTFLNNADINERKYSYQQKKTIVQEAAKRMGYSPLDLEQSIWHSNPKREQKGAKMYKPTSYGQDLPADEENHIKAKITSQGKADKYRYKTGPAAGLMRAEIRIPKAATKILPYKRNQYPVDITVVIGQKEYAAKLHFAASQEAAWISSVLDKGNFELIRALKPAGFDICQHVRLKVIGNKIWVL